MAAASLYYVLAFLYLRPDANPVPQECENIARHLAAGEGFSLSWFSTSVQPSANQEPVYPLLMAMFFRWVPSPYSSLLVLQVGVWLSAAWILSGLAQRLVGASRPLTALVVALWPPLGVYALSYHPLWLRAATLIFVVTLALRYRDQPDRWRSLALGFGLGAAALVRAPFLVLPTLIVPWAILGDTTSTGSGGGKDREFAERISARLNCYLQRLKQRLSHLVIIGIAAGVVLSPWVIRNWVVLGAWVPGTTTAGYTALLGNHPGASGAMEVEALRPMQKFTGEFWQLPELERDMVFRQQVIAFWREHPAEAAGLYLKKLVYLWTWWPNVGVNYRSSWTWGYLALWSMSLPMILIGWRLARRNQAAVAPGLFLGLWCFFSLLYALFAVNLRFRFELEGLLLPYALITARDIVNRVKGRYRLVA
ncbi:MAG: hypothetical protein EXS58_09045 [Candidatus Latescibacteria bacterium]|nr:hypothetical protein [Candidatus Latescibacterota bacterium]